MEIERKFLVSPSFDYKSYPFKELEQGYLNVKPVIRVRREDDEYYMTYKGGGMMIREEYNLPLNRESYDHLIKKADGNLITKRRYLIPFGKYTIELDDFSSPRPLLMAEIEFESEEEALAFTPPEWFLEEVTNNPAYHNSNMI